VAVVGPAVHGCTIPGVVAVVFVPGVVDCVPVVPPGAVAVPDVPVVGVPEVPGVGVPAVPAPDVPCPPAAPAEPLEPAAPVCEAEG